MSDPQQSNEFFNGLRDLGDPVADEVVADIFANGSLETVNELLVHLVSNDQPIPDQLPAGVRRYLEATSELPEWADPQMLRAGEAVFLDMGPLCLLSLVSASLPVCYSMSKAVQVLGTTQQLSAHTTRRILETAQLIVDVMQRGGLGSNGQGVRSAQRVRLMHATIRHLLLAPPPAQPRAPRNFADVLLSTPWDVDRLGVPICQEDMAGTVLTFSWIVIRSLERMRQDLDAADKQAYFHCWRVVGHLMGVRAELLPETWQAGRDLFQQLQDRQLGTTSEGQLLTERILATTSELISKRVTRLPALTKHLPRLFIYLLNDPDTITAIGVTRLNWLERILALPMLRLSLAVSALFSRIAGRSRLLHGLQGALAWALVQHLAQLPRGYDRGLFAMPAELMESWSHPQSEPSGTRP